jgi:trafficking protein particle complex subunit 9
MYLRNAVIDDDMLRALLSSAAMPKAESASRASDTISLKKSDIATMLLRAIPPFAEAVPLNELLQILIGLASNLSMVGMERKQAFILRELLQRITPALIEARKVGAAEMGIHPAAGLLALSTASHSGFLHIEAGMKSLLTMVGKMYTALDEEEDKTIISSIQGQRASLKTSRRAKLHANGNFDLKVDILKLCIAICEVLPDFGGVLTYTVHLLHLSRRAIIVPIHEPSDTPTISLEEQTRLMNSIERTVEAARRVGITNINATYWDDYLVRGIEAIAPSAALRVTPHSMNDLQLTSESEEGIRQGPFIYNPFSKPISSVTDQPLVANELAYFSVFLQNPYEVDIEIDQITLLAEGCEFQPSKHSIVLGHFCCQRFTMAGTPTRSGTLTITGCKAKIRYCEGRDFHIFPKEWRPKTELKLKKVSYAAREVSRGWAPSAAVKPMQNSAQEPSVGPESVVVSLTVINAQPIVSIQSTTLSQPALMVLEGEKKSIDIVLQNESTTTAVDFVLFTFQDSATTQLRTALSNKELSPIELYELQLQLAERAPFKHVANRDIDKPAIPAGKSATFTIEALGIPGLLNGTVQLNYACLGLDPSDIRDKIYTRQLSLTVAVTVNAGIEVPRCNMLPFSGDFAWSNKQRVSASSRQSVDASAILAPGFRSRSTSYTHSQNDGGQFTSLLARLGLGSHGHDHCLLLLDLRNVWPFPLSISVQVRESHNASSMSPTDPWRRAYTVHESIQPGHVSRAVLLIPRVYVLDPHKPIPVIGNQRQFVVSASKLSVEAEQANREAFWYREEVLKHVRGTWREDSTGREGTIDLRRGIRLNAKMIEALRIDDIEIALSIQPSVPSATLPPPMQQEGRSRFTLQNNCFATLTAKVHNRSSRAIHVLLRIQPSLRDQPNNIALDLSKRFAWTGMLQRVLHPPLEPGEVRDARLGIMALCSGSYEIAATVEELKVSIPAPSSAKPDPSSQFNDRRIWHARETCLIDTVEQIQP